MGNFEDISVSIYRDTVINEGPGFDRLNEKQKVLIITKTNCLNDSNYLSAANLFDSGEVCMIFSFLSIMDITALFFPTNSAKETAVSTPEYPPPITAILTRSDPDI